MSVDHKDPQPSIELPEGTVTFLFTDIEGSTELLRRLGDHYAELLEEQRRIVRTCVAKFDGQEVDTQGDSFFISFPRATQAVSAAVAIQQAIHEHAWPEGVDVRLRIGLHTGEPLTWAEGYVGIDVHRAARIAAVGHGGQVLLSETTAPLIRDDLPEGVSLLDLGRHLLKDLPQPELICQLEIEGMSSAFPPLKSEDAGLPRHNLPAQLTAFIGRAFELEALEKIVADPAVRLITIVAPGGMGKTRLALALAEKQVSIRERTNGKIRGRFPNGVFFVPLAPLTSPSSILPAIAEALNFQIVSSEGRIAGAGGETRSPKKQVLDYLRSKRLLLVMDNFEHLLDGVGFLNEVIASAPEVKVLATSRERLNVKAEHLFPLTGLKFPEVDIFEETAEIDFHLYSALALFLESARRSKPEFTIVDENLEDVVSVCRLLGGMPLGIELAASWLNALTVREIAVEIQRSLDFLETRLRDVDERHRSMQAVFNGTWDRLSTTEKDLFMKLTVFQGGFTRQAAAEVAGASLQALTDLSHRSLLQFDPSSGRYEIHALLRQFGAEKLAQEGELESSVRDGHSEYFCVQLRNLEAALKGARHPEAMKAIEIDHENILAAWSRAADRGDIPALAQTLDALDLYFESSGRMEEAEQFFRLIATMVSRTDSVEAMRFLLRLNTVLSTYIPRNRENQALQLLSDTGNLLQASSLRDVDTRYELACLLAAQGDWEWGRCKAISFHQQAYDLFQALDDRWNMANQLLRIAGTKQVMEDVLETAQQCLALYRGLGYGKGIAKCLDRMSAWMATKMEFAQAEQCLEESLKISEEMGDQITKGWTLLFVGYVQILQGRFDDAENTFQDALTLNLELGQSFSVVYANLELARILNHKGLNQDALVLAAETLIQAEEENFRSWIGELHLEMGAALLGQGELIKGEDQIRSGIREFRDLGDNVYLSYLLPVLGVCLFARQDYGGMREVVEEFLQLVNPAHKLDVAFGFPAMSLLQLAEGEVEKAVEYYAYASSHGYIAHSIWYQDLVWKPIAKAAETLGPEAKRAAWERGLGIDPLEVVERLSIKFTDAGGKRP